MFIQHRLVNPWGSSLFCTDTHFSFFGCVSSKASKSDKLHLTLGMYALRVGLAERHAFWKLAVFSFSFLFWYFTSHTEGRHPSHSVLVPSPAVKPGGEPSRTTAQPPACHLRFCTEAPCGRLTQAECQASWCHLKRCFSRTKKKWTRVYKQIKRTAWRTKGAGKTGAFTVILCFCCQFTQDILLGT